MGQSVSTALARVRTPRERGFPLAALPRGRMLPALVARVAIWIARRKGKPLRLGKRYLAVRHQDVAEMLRRDLDFTIAPVNAQRIEAVNGGPFILGMDRSPALIYERGALYRALARLDMATVEAEIRDDIARTLDGLGKRFDALADFARPVAARTACRVFGIAPDDRGLFAEAVRAIFAHTFLNIQGALLARGAAPAGKMQWAGPFPDRLPVRLPAGTMP